MLAEINFLWDYPAITAIAGHDAHIDAATLNFMRQHAHAYVEGDQVACVEVASLGSDVTIFRTKNMDQIPPNSPHPAIDRRAAPSPSTPPTAPPAATSPAWQASRGGTGGNRSRSRSPRGSIHRAHCS